MTVLGHRSPTATSGTSAVSGVRGHGAQVAEITDADAFAVQRTDHLGLPLAKRQELMAQALPYGTTLYVGLFTEMPDRLGIGGTQSSIARVTITRWVSAVRGANVRRTNAQSLTWDEVASPVVLVGWGVWDAATDGVLQAFDYLRNASETPVEHTLAVGFRPSVASGKIGLVF